MVDRSRQAGAVNDKFEGALVEAISEAVVAWFGDAGDYGVPCDEITGESVALDALTRLREKMKAPFASTAAPSHQGQCIG
jgi:hypothetical protein